MKRLLIMVPFLCCSCSLPYLMMGDDVGKASKMSSAASRAGGDYIEEFLKGVSDQDFKEEQYQKLVKAHEMTAIAEMGSNAIHDIADPKNEAADVDLSIGAAIEVTTQMKAKRVRYEKIQSTATAWWNTVVGPTGQKAGLGSLIAVATTIAGIYVKKNADRKNEIEERRRYEDRLQGRAIASGVSTDDITSDQESVSARLRAERRDSYQANKTEQDSLVKVLNGGETKKSV